MLSNGTFLGPDEIRNMRTVPELVFVNCCHLGSGRCRSAAEHRYDRAEFASGVAGALIAIGVRCVVAAGWAVDDDAASVFAEEFYGSLLRGNRFIVAVGEARAAARERSPHVNTWAAYQCYGDPGLGVPAEGAGSPTRPPRRSVEDFSGCGLGDVVEARARADRRPDTKFQGADVAEQLDNLAQLEKLFGPKWGGSGDVAELFGEAFVEAGDVESGHAVVRARRRRARRKGVDEGGGAAGQRPRPSRLGDRRQGGEASRRR